MNPLSPARLSRRAVLVSGLAVMLAGCGRRGALEPPPGSEQAKRLEQQRGSSEAQAGTTGLRGGSRRPPRIERPKDSFILDPLLD